MGGSVDLAFPNPSEATELIKAGRLRPLAVFAPQRLPNYPDRPTTREAGYDVTFEQFRGLIGPGGLTPDQSLYWQNAIEKMTNSSPWKSYLSSNALRPMALFGPPALDYIAQENDRLTEALKELGIAQP